MYKIFTNTIFIGSEVIYLPECHSTNAIASELIREKHFGEGTLVITDHQLAGRGQRGNQWLSEPAQNLTFSIILKPAFLHPAENFYLNIMTSLALIDFFLTYNETDFRIKWPNDLYFREKKIAGILIENTLKANSTESSVTGIGLNVNQEEFPGLDQAISMKMIFRKIFDLNELLNQLVVEIESRYMKLRSGEYLSLKAEYQQKLYWMNELHIFEDNTGDFQGRICGIDDSGRLLINKAGKVKSYNFQEIKFIK